MFEYPVRVAGAAAGGELLSWGHRLWHPPQRSGGAIAALVQGGIQNEKRVGRKIAEHLPVGDGIVFARCDLSDLGKAAELFNGFGRG